MSDKYLDFSITQIDNKIIIQITHNDGDIDKAIQATDIVMDVLEELLEAFTKFANQP